METACAGTSMFSRSDLFCWEPLQESGIFPYFGLKFNHRSVFTARHSHYPNEFHMWLLFASGL